LADGEDVLFELKGHPYIFSDHETEGDCFFVVAKPFPSRNTAVVNTYLELKTENEQLQKRVLALRSLVSAESPPALTTPGSTQTMQNTDASGSYYHSLNAHSTRFENVISSTSFDGHTYDGGPTYTYPSTVSQSVEEDNEEGSKKKKVKKLHFMEQYVCITCGRTDSPEWRKGPLGPKTLCNACGLRWAKQMRRFDDPTEGSEGTVTGS